MMAKKKARATLHYFDAETGVKTGPSHRTYARLCEAERPQTFEIKIPARGVLRRQVIVITRAEIERVLDANP